MDKRRDLLEDFPTISTLVALGVLVLLFFVFLIFTLLSTGRFKNNNAQIEVPDIVSSFLSELTTDGADVGDVLARYVVTTVIDNDDSGNIGSIRDTLSFEYVMTVFEGSPHGYEIMDSTTDYLEFCILNEDGERTYPRIAFSYILTEDGSKIADYSIGRLQPFSRRDEEYDVRWNK